MNSPVEQIKERLSIVDVISSYTKLEKAGQHWKACCPFHNEKTPSFFVSPVRGTYHCFGCGKGGDIFSFVGDIEGLTFPETLKTLAARAGVVLEQHSSLTKDKNAPLYRVLEYATRFFEAHLAKSHEARDYLAGRGLSEETIRNFRLGLAPDGWRNLSDFLLSKGFTEKTLEDAGLLVPSARGGYDKFRGRVMFPIMDPQGKVVAFTGRILPSLDKEGTAKYMNSPETALYNKSRILYGYHKAKQAMLKENTALLVEGQMDLLMAHQAGTGYAVAVSGTALTEEHLLLLKRFTKTLLIAFDPDEAGFKALERAVMLALSLEITVYALPLSGGLDPADLIAKDPLLWNTALSLKKPFIEFYLEYLKEKNMPEREFVGAVSQKILPYVAILKSSVDQAYYIKKIAEATHLPEESFVKELQRMSKDQSFTTSPSPLPTSEQKGKGVRETMVWKLLGVLLVEEAAPETKVNTSDIRGRLEKLLEISYDEMIKNLPEGLPDQLIFEAELMGEGKDRGGDAEELLLNIEQDILEEKFTTLSRMIIEKERKSDPSDLEPLLQQCQDISKRINEIINRRHQQQ